MNDLFFDGYSLGFLILPLIVACAAMHISAGVHWSLILRDLGVPLGLIGTFTGFRGILQNVEGSSGVMVAIGITLLTILYGGVLSSIGYFWKFRSIEIVGISRTANEVKWWVPWASIITFLSFLFWASSYAYGLEWFIENVSLGVFTVIALIALLISNRQNNLQALSQSFLLSAMINSLIGIIYYYHGVIGEGIAIGSQGIIYSLSAYICLYLISFKISDPETLNAPLMNWHWLEISGFVIFMFLAPVSLPEFVSNIEDDEKDQNLELRIQELERKLDLLSQHTTQ
jgi:hypothetical protein